MDGNFENKLFNCFLGPLSCSLGALVAKIFKKLLLDYFPELLFCVWDHLSVVLDLYGLKYSGVAVLGPWMHGLDCLHVSRAEG